MSENAVKSTSESDRPPFLGSLALGVWAFGTALLTAGVVWNHGFASALIAFGISVVGAAGGCLVVCLTRRVLWTLEPHSIIQVDASSAEVS